MAAGPGDGEPTGAPVPEAEGEVSLAVLNAIKLSLSLVATILVAVVVRIYVPRYFSPDMFGRYSFAEAFAATFFSFSTFGIDTYIRKEVATRLDHANDFYAGFFVLRLLVAVLICVAMAITLPRLSPAGARDPMVWQLVFLFALGQIAFVDNTTLSAFLQASGSVNELAWANVLSKLGWCAAIFASLAMGGSIVWVAVWFSAAELAKTVFLMATAHRRLHLRWKINRRATALVLRASLPFFLNNIALSIYAKVNIILLEHYSSPTEVGWYSAAMTIAGFSLLFLPVLQAVIMPLAARTARQSTEAMNEVMRGGSRLVVVLGTLISLCLWLHADFVAVRCFGAAYAPAAGALRMIAPMFPLTYMATVGSMHLIQLGRTWVLMRVSIAAVLLNPLANVPLILWGLGRGPGQAGAASAVATVLTELVTLTVTMALLGRAGFDRRTAVTAVKVAAICGVIVAAHRALQYLGIWLLPAEVVAYLALVVALRALPVGEVAQMVAQARRRRTA